MKITILRLGLAAAVLASVGCGAPEPSGEEGAGAGGGSECGDHCGGAGGASTGTAPAGGNGPSSAVLTILSTASRGPGCPPPAVVHASYDEGDRTVTLTLPPLSLPERPGSSFNHSSCTTGLTVEGVAGWQFAATSRAIRGAADLPDGASARVTTTVFFAASPASAELETRIEGARRGEYGFSDTFPAGSVLRSPCGQDTIFNVGVGASLQKNARDMASFDVQSVELAIVWQEC